MPKNKGKGGKNRKRGKNEADDVKVKRELVYKDDGQEYALVTRMLGNGRFYATCVDGVTRQCHIRGNLHKKVWINNGDIILVSLREYQDEKSDIIMKYIPDEARLLRAYGELPENMRLNDEEDGPSDDYIEFEEDVDKL